MGKLLGKRQNIKSINKRYEIKNVQNYQLKEERRFMFEERTVKREIIYKGKVLTLRKDKVLIKGGKTSYREIIEHNGAVGILPITENEKVILVKQYRKAAEKIILEIPAGKIEGKDDPFETAKRELKEETGYTAKEMKFITKIYPAIGYSTELIYIYMAKGLLEGETDFDEGEDIQVLEIKLEKAIEMVYSGEIEDAKTIIALLMAKDYMK